MVPRIRLIRVQSVVITLNKPGHRQGHETRTVLCLCVYGTLQISDWTKMWRPISSGVQNDGHDGSADTRVHGTSISDVGIQ